MPYRQELPIPKDVETRDSSIPNKPKSQMKLKFAGVQRNLGLQSNLDMNVEEMRFYLSQPPNNRTELCDPGYQQLERVKESSRKQSSLPRADGAANPDGEGAVGEGTRGERQRALGEVAQGSRWARESAARGRCGSATRDRPPRRTIPCCIATAVPETTAKPNQAYVRTKQMCGNQERSGMAQEE